MKRGNGIVHMNFHCCRMQPTQAVPPPDPTGPRSLLLPSPTVALTTTVTAATIRALGTPCVSLSGWDPDISSVQTPGDKAVRPPRFGVSGGKQQMRETIIRLKEGRLTGSAVHSTPGPGRAAPLAFLSGALPPTPGSFRFRTQAG